MEISLTWDLFVIVFFALVITYSFIIGKHEAVKIIIATYIAIVAVQGLGNLLLRLTGESQPVLDVLGVRIDITLLSTTKLVLFIAVIIFIAIKSGLEIEYGKEPPGIINAIATGAFGVATGGLLLSTLLTYIAGVPILDANLAKAAAVSPIMAQSELMRMMIVYQDVWFALPALLLIVVGFISKE